MGLSPAGTYSRKGGSVSLRVGMLGLRGSRRILRPGLHLVRLLGISSWLLAHDDWRGRGDDLLRPERHLHG